MHIYLQFRCNNLSKQRIKKQLYNLEKGKGQFHFEGWGYNVHVPELPMPAWNVCNTIFFYWILHGIIIVHFVLWFVSNMFSLFIVVMSSIITTHWSLIFYEISFCHAMPKCNVMFIVNPSWHCSLFEKQRDIVLFLKYAITYHAKL